MDDLWISWNQLNDIIREKEVVLFGAGHSVKYTLNMVSKKPGYILDNNQSKQGGTFLGIDIVPPEFVQQLDQAFMILITTPLYTSVQKQLENMGLQAGVDFFCSPALYNMKISDGLKNHDKTILFSNGDMPDDREDSGGGVFLYHLQTKQTKKIYSGKCHQLVKSGERYYVIDELEGVKVFNQEFQLVESFGILPWSIAHGIAVNEEQNILYVANTELDLISELDLQTGKQLGEIYISSHYDGERQDRHHVNDLCFYNGHLYASMFSFSGLWKSGCYDGGIVQIDVNTKQVVSHPIRDQWMPHSVTFINGEITFANSMPGEVYKTGNRVLLKVDGFTRGIDYDGKYYYIGMSEHRYFDRMKPFSHNIQVNCGIFLYDEKNQASRFFNFDDMKNIHSILVID